MPTHSRKVTQAVAQLDAIEAEMRRIGYWQENPPDLLEQFRSGAMRSYLDAPTFELWLQCVFLPNARKAALDDAFPSRSQVGQMAQRQYNYHSDIPEAFDLLALLHDFDRIIEGSG